ncbi:hypothetical protein AAG906_038796 [Vitis piasezkii]
MTMGPASTARPYFLTRCVRTTHPDIFFAGGRRIHCNALIEILLLVITIAAGEFCHQHWRRLWEPFFFSVNPIPSNCKDDFTLKESFFRQKKRTTDANSVPRNKKTQGRKQCLEDPKLSPTSALSAEAGPLSQPGSSTPPRGEPNPRGA